MSAGDCPFCAPDASRIFHAGTLSLGLWDSFPVSPGHALLVPKRHIPSWFDATSEEQAELMAGTEVARQEIEKMHQPDGFNIGINIGAAAGQTVPHLHVHVIPRYAGDVSDPRGGVRFVVPDKANYLTTPMDDGAILADRAEEFSVENRRSFEAPHDSALITGGDDPLLSHVRAHLDWAAHADIAVAFILESGLALLGEHFRDLVARRGRLRIVTGDYLGVTDPKALLELLDLKEEYPDRVELWIFEAAQQSFHAKSFVFHDGSGGGIALVGSSNLTRPALTKGVEWNFRTIPARDRTGYLAVRKAFEELLHHRFVRPLDAAWVDNYRKLRRPKPEAVALELELPEPPPEPHSIQVRALAALEETRAEGNSAGLVVLATGLGKTWLSAFDSARPEFRRVLFVAHREEILRQAMKTYRQIRPEAHLGLYNGQEKVPDAEAVFASVQTLGRKVHLERFAADEFDYIVIDEFHHAAAKTYRRVIDFFEPKFLLGLTATPERTDGGDLLSLCQENLVFRADLAEGIREGLLSPFHYFGVPDEVDYENIPWRSSRFDEEALTQAVATQSRAENALEQYRERGGKRALGFCCSTRHADFMRQFFRDAGVRAAAVHSETSSDPRTASLEKLAAGELDIVFSVDMFNEGVDIPSVDTVMMLRPTESRILWLQQFGRGLRKAEGKDHLNVIDYIGNHRTFLLKPQTLFELPAGDAHIGKQLMLVQRGEADLPPGCEVTYDLEAIDILRSLLRLPRDGEAIRFFYEDFRERCGIRPTASEMHHEGYGPRSLRKSYGSWFGFVGAMGDLEPGRGDLIRNGSPADFLRVLETTQMTRSYKMLVLLGMLNAGHFPGEISIGDLAKAVKRLARPSAALKKDLGVSIDDERALVQRLERDPIDAWVGGRGTGGTAYFEYADGVLRTTFSVAASDREAFGDMVREIAEWRLAEYLDRAVTADLGDRGGFVCSVSHADGTPILFYPSRIRNPSIPEGWIDLIANGERLQANFVEVALNVVRREGSTQNVLAEILRGWFGPHAGQPGTNQKVLFEWAGDDLTMRPFSKDVSGTGLEIGRSYMRAEIPPAFDLEFKRMVWEQGFVWQGDNIFLLVTLDKKGMPKDHQYGDRFLSPDLFEWKSQNRHTQASKAGQAMRDHADRGISIHLLVRKTRKIGSKAAPFIYCGHVGFVDWKGERPITIRWRLREPLSDRLFGLFEVREH